MIIVMIAFVIKILIVMEFYMRYLYLLLSHSSPGELLCSCTVFIRPRKAVPNADER